MTENTQYIIACVNGLPPSDIVCEYSTWISKSCQLPIKILHTLDQSSKTSQRDLSGNLGPEAKSELLEEYAEDQHKKNKAINHKALTFLENYKANTLSQGAIQAKVCLRSGELLENLENLQKNSSLVVLGRYGIRHQDSKDSLSLGHQVESVVRRLEKPILVVSKDFKEPQKITLAYDGSEAANKALEFISQRKLFRDKEIHIISIDNNIDNPSLHLKLAEDKLASTHKNVKTQAFTGKAFDVINTYIKEHDIDLMVMGAFSHNKIHDFIKGSFTAKMLASHNIPLLLVK